MFDYIKGQITVNRNTTLVVENQGIGYRVRCSLRTAVTLPRDCEAQVYIHQHTVQEQTQLFGFAATDERDLFLQIIAISGIGPKVALAVLSTMSSAELLRAVHLGDEASFTAVPGVGKMTAKRLLLELGKKLQQVELSDGKEQDDSNLAAILEALEALGFNRARVEPQVHRQLHENPELSVEDVLRSVLQHHGRK
ncbi:MAG: Holliday junction branch migration protein RuvA [Candidatus Delongbacteria bacterium]|nr:Holliday junction branch migration protein RuvA [Candidatus Delongbacteria bacterium]